MIGEILSGAGLLAGLVGGWKSTNEYDPESRALKRFYELTDPSSGHFRTLRAMYGRALADSAPTTDTFLSLARSGGLSSTSSAVIAREQSEAVSSRNREQLLNQMNRSFIDAEQMAQGYLGMDYQMRAASQESRGSFWDQGTGLSGGLLSKYLFPNNPGNAAPVVKEKATYPGLDEILSGGGRIR